MNNAGDNLTSFFYSSYFTLCGRPYVASELKKFDSPALGAWNGLAKVMEICPVFCQLISVTLRYTTCQKFGHTF